VSRVWVHCTTGSTGWFCAARLAHSSETVIKSRFVINKLSPSEDEQRHPVPFWNQRCLNGETPEQMEIFRLVTVFLFGGKLCAQVASFIQGLSAELTFPRFINL
jgi:hypothetical protein